MISPTLTSLLSQRRQFGLICKKNVALKFTWKIVALFTKNYPSVMMTEIKTIDGGQKDALLRMAKMKQNRSVRD